MGRIRHIKPEIPVLSRTSSLELDTGQKLKCVITYLGYLKLLILSFMPFLHLSQCLCSSVTLQIKSRGTERSAREFKLCRKNDKGKFVQNLRSLLSFF